MQERTAGTGTLPRVDRKLVTNAAASDEFRLYPRIASGPPNGLRSPRYAPRRSDQQGTDPRWIVAFTPDLAIQNSPSPRAQPARRENRPIRFEWAAFSGTAECLCSPRSAWLPLGLVCRRKNDGRSTQGGWQLRTLEGTSAPFGGPRITYRPGAAPRRPDLDGCFHLDRTQPGACRLSGRAAWFLTDRRRRRCQPLTSFPMRRAEVSSRKDNRRSRAARPAADVCYQPLPVASPAAVAEFPAA